MLTCHWKFTKMNYKGRVKLGNQKMARWSIISYSLKKRVVHCVIDNHTIKNCYTFNKLYITSFPWQTFTTLTSIVRMLIVVVCWCFAILILPTFCKYNLTHYDLYCDCISTCYNFDYDYNPTCCHLDYNWNLIFYNCNVTTFNFYNYNYVLFSRQLSKALSQCYQNYCGFWKSKYVFFSSKIEDTSFTHCQSWSIVIY